MGDFARYDMTYYIEVGSKTIYNKIKSSLSRLGLSQIDSSKEKASVCIIDASLYFSNKLDIDKKYETCLKIISKEDCLKYYDSIFDGIGFVLRFNFTIEELEESIFFIQEHLNNKFQNQILKTIFDSANNSLVITDTKGVIQYANRYF